MEFIDILKRPEMRRIFGERELEIIEKQMLGIRLTPSEITRLSRDIRKKFLAIQLLKEFDLKELKKGSKLKRNIESVKQDILESDYFPRIKKIALYGSSAYGIRTYRSDIDISVEFDKIDLKEATKFKIYFGINEKVQVEVYNFLAEKIKKDIDLKGKVLYERKNKR